MAIFSRFDVQFVPFLKGVGRGRQPFRAGMDIFSQSFETLSEWTTRDIAAFVDLALYEKPFRFLRRRC